MPPRAPAPRGAVKAKLQISDKENIGGKGHTSGAVTVPPYKIPEISQPVLEELERKYDIEGCNTVDIVYARQENDAARRYITEQEKKLKEKDDATQLLLRELADLKARVASGQTIVDAGNGGADLEQEESGSGLASDELEEERSKNAELQRRLDELERSNLGSKSANGPKNIARPAGSAGKDFNIQNEMGLGNRANREIYKTLLGNIRDLTLQAGIDWESSWAKISAGTKAKLFDVARARHPILADYVNDWATEEIAKQFIKNRRRESYRKGLLDVPEKYAYLKANSAKRDPSGSRKRRIATATVPKKAAAGPRKAKVAAASRSVQVHQKAKNGSKPKAKAGSSKAKGKKTAMDSDNDDDDASMHDSEDEEEEDDDCTWHLLAILSPS